MAQPAMAQFGHQWSWESGGCDCCGSCSCQDCGVCLKSCLCPCCVYGQNKATLEGRQDCGSDCCLYCVLSFFCLECCVAKNARRKLRDMFGLKADGPCGCGDCMSHFCCARCALCQESREINMRVRAASAGQMATAHSAPTAAPGQQFMTAAQPGYATM